MKYNNFKEPKIKPFTQLDLFGRVIICKYNHGPFVIYESPHIKICVKCGVRIQ